MAKRIGMKSLNKIPTLEELAAQPELSQALAPDDAQKLSWQCVSALNALMSIRLGMNGHPAHPKATPEEPWLTTQEVCTRYGKAFTKRWLHDHREQLGGKKLSRKKLVFNPKLIDKFLKRI